MALAIALAVGGAAWASWASGRRTTEEPLEPAAAPAQARDEPDDASSTTPSAPTEDAPDFARDPSLATPHGHATDPTHDGSSAASPETTTHDAATDDSEPPTARPRDPPRAPATPGRLQVNVLPWAEVTVDGRSLGRVPVDVELPPGHHRVRLYNPQIGDRTVVIELRAGGVHKISRW
jgi:serine/threonine-protein kinase